MVFEKKRASTYAEVAHTAGTSINDPSKSFLSKRVFSGMQLEIFVSTSQFLWRYSLADIRISYLLRYCLIELSTHKNHFEHSALVSSIIAQESLIVVYR